MHMNSETDFEAQRFGKYILLDRLGRGGMAEVFRAKSFGPGGFEKECAIKRILPQLTDDESFVKMFIDEAKVTAFLTHANIVQVLDLGELDGQLFIAMEYVAGKDLLDLLARCARRARRVPRELVLFIMTELLKGLGHAHGAVNSYGEPIGIIHRDVSPSNILLSYAGQVKVGDFGIAKSQLQSSFTDAGTQKGKMGYMSPEQVTGSSLDIRSDLFAATVIFFEMLTMSRLFKAPNDLDVMLKIRDCRIEEDLEKLRGLPVELRDVVVRGLAQDPRDRFQSADEFLEVLQDFVFRNDIKVGEQHLAAFLREVFADAIADQRARRSRDPSPASAASLISSAPKGSYHYRDPSGDVHGPLSHATLQHLLMSTPAHVDEELSVDGGPWGGVDDYPSFQSLPRLEAYPNDETGTQPRAGSLLRVGDGSDHRMMVADWEELSVSSTHDVEVRERVRAARATQERQRFVTPGIRKPSASTPPARLSERPRERRSVAATFGPPVRTGTVGLASVTRIVYRLWRAKATGILRIVNEDDAFDLVFRDGDPVSVYIADELDVILRVLRDYGISVSEASLAQIADVATEGAKLAEVLVTQRILAPHQIFTFLTDRFREKFTAALFVAEGTWEYWPDVEVDSTALPSNLHVAEHVIQSLQGRARLPYLRAFFEERMRRQLVQRITGQELSHLHLSAKALRVVTSIHPGETCGQVVRRFVDVYRWKDFEILQTLFTLTEFEIFGFEGEARPKLPM